MYLLPYFQFLKLLNECKHFSTKVDKFSVAVPHPLVITLTGLATLCVLFNPYILPNISGLKTVKSSLDNRQDQFPPTACIIEALKLCLECNNSIFNDKHFLQSDGTAQGPHMSCSYCDIVIQYFDVKALEYTPATICWKRFRGDIFVVWPHSIDELDMFFDYMNKVDPYEKTQFTVEVDTDTLEFL